MVRTAPYFPDCFCCSDVDLSPGSERCELLYLSIVRRCQSRPAFAISIRRRGCNRRDLRCGLRLEVTLRQPEVIMECVVQMCNSRKTGWGPRCESGGMCDGVASRQYVYGGSISCMPLWGGCPLPQWDHAIAIAPIRIRRARTAGPPNLTA